MAGSLSGGTALTALVREDREWAKRQIRRMLLDEAGEAAAVARRFEVSRAFFWHMLYKLGMGGEPARAREEARKRFRLRG